MQQKYTSNSPSAHIKPAEAAIKSIVKLAFMSSYLLRLLTLCLTLSLAACGMTDGKFTLDFSASQLQNAIAPKFPIDNCPLPLTCLKLQNPQVSLAENSDRIGLGFESQLSVALQTVTGTIKVSSKPRYQASTGEIFLDDSRIEDVQAPGLPPAVLGLLKQYGAPLMQQALQRAPIYTFKNAQLEKIARMGIADVKVVGGKLQVTIDPALAQGAR
jgi:Protein of unknown function (DUF1439)